jgi:hypothetical protein
MPRWFAALFLAIGMICLTAAGFVYRHAQAFAGRAERADGRIVDVVYRSARPGETIGTYGSVFRFTTRDGRTVQATASVRATTSRHRVGDAVRVLYDPQDPRNALIDSIVDRYFVLIVLLPIGLGFTAVGAPGLIVIALRKRKEAWLRERGQPVEAKLTGVIRMQNGLMPWRITADWHDPFRGQVVALQSRNLYEDPTRHVEVGQTVKAWVDPDRPSRHWIDVSFLPDVRD